MSRRDPTRAQVLAATEPTAEQVRAAERAAQLELPHDVPELPCWGVLDVFDYPKPGLAQTEGLPVAKRRASPVVGECPSYRAVTDEEAAADRVAVAALVAAAVRGQGPQCGATLESKTSACGRTTVRNCPVHGFVTRECRRVGEP